MQFSIIASIQLRRNTFLHSRITIKQLINLSIYYCLDYLNVLAELPWLNNYILDWEDMTLSVILGVYSVKT